MKEAYLRKKAIQLLQKQGWIVWFPKKVKFQETDIFGCYDLICARGSEIRLIQITTTPNLSARRRKIKNFLDVNQLKLPSEVWAYSKKIKCFKIEKIDDI